LDASAILADMPSDPHTDERPTTPAKRSRKKAIFRWGMLLLLIMSLAASLFANILLYRQADTSYRELQETRLDPYGLKYTEFKDPAPATGPSTKPVAVFFGDSRARDWPAPNVPGFQFVHRGIGGQTTEQVYGRIEPHLLALSPRVVILQAGINDLKNIGLFPNRKAWIVLGCRTNLRRIIEQSEKSGATVIVSTIFPTGDVPLERQLTWSPEIDKAVEEINADLRSQASERVIVFDAWKLLEQNGKLRPGVGKDTLHLTPEGYEVLNAKLAEIFTSQIK
jgi:lysophospholipase L1-like esterase